jgi:hypothetical protein
MPSSYTATPERFMSKEQEKAQLEESYPVEKLAGLLVDHITNDEGKVLARVYESSSFRENYDKDGNL